MVQVQLDTALCVEVIASTAIRLLSDAIANHCQGATRNTLAYLVDQIAIWCKSASEAVKADVLYGPIVFYERIRLMDAWRKRRNISLPRLLSEVKPNCFFFRRYSPMRRNCQHGIAPYITILLRVARIRTYSGHRRAFRAHTKDMFFRF